MVYVAHSAYDPFGLFVMMHPAPCIFPLHPAGRAELTLSVTKLVDNIANEDAIAKIAKTTNNFIIMLLTSFIYTL